MIWIEIMQFKFLATAELNFELKNFVTQIKKSVCLDVEQKICLELEIFFLNPPIHTFLFHGKN